MRISAVKAVYKLGFTAKIPERTGRMRGNSAAGSDDGREGGGRERIRYKGLVGARGLRD